MSEDTQAPDLGGEAAGLLRQVQRLLVDELQLDVAPTSLRMDDALHAPPIRIDSLGYLRLMSGLERAFGIPFEPESLGDAVFATVGDVVRFVLSERG